MLDIVCQISASRKRKRIYGRIINGIKFARSHNQVTYFLTLTSYITSSKDRPLNLMEKFAELVRRIRKKYGLFEYCGVSTIEGYGTLHIIFKSNRRIAVSWLRKEWIKLNDAPQMKLVKTYGSINRLANYLTNYLASQLVVRYVSSSLWLYVGWTRDFYDFIRKNGFREGILKFDQFLSNYDTKALYSQKYSKQLDLNLKVVKTEECKICRMFSLRMVK